MNITMSFSARLAKTIKVFTKVSDDLEKLLQAGSDKCMQIDNEVDKLHKERLEIMDAMGTATKIKAKIFDIIGDNV